MIRAINSVYKLQAFIAEIKYAVEYYRRVAITWTM